MSKIKIYCLHSDFYFVILFFLLEVIHRFEAFKPKREVLVLLSTNSLMSAKPPASVAISWFFLNSIIHFLWQDNVCNQQTGRGWSHSYAFHRAQNNNTIFSVMFRTGGRVAGWRAGLWLQTATHGEYSTPWDGKAETKKSFKFWPSF